MISDKHKFIFVHINKTGGTSIEKVFYPEADLHDVPDKHEPISWYLENHPDKFKAYFKFALVRNPWDWLVSRYHWSRDKQGVFEFSFEEFLHRLDNKIALSDQAPWLEAALEPQLNRITIDGKIAVDFVGRFENLEKDFARICSKLNLEPIALPHVFKTNHLHYVKYYDRKSREIVRKLYGKDVEAFGYSFGRRPSIAFLDPVPVEVRARPKNRPGQLAADFTQFRRSALLLLPKLFGFLRRVIGCPPRSLERE